MSRQRDQVNRAEVQRILERIYTLPRAAQLNLFATLRAYLSSEDAPKNQLDVRIQAQAESLDVMRRVAEHYRLPDGRAPTASQWRTAPAALTEGWGVTRVVKVWGRFRFAQAAFRGEELTGGSARKSLERKTVRRWSRYEDEIEGVRRWLDTEPASEVSPDYDDFAREHNDAIERRDAGGKLLRQARAVAKNLNLGWTDVVAVARRQADAGELRERRREEASDRDSGPLGLVCLPTVAAMLGHTGRSEDVAEQAGFPKFVVRLGRIRGWVAEDIEAYRDGREVAERAEGEMQRLIVGTVEMAQIRGYASAESVVAMLHRSPGRLPAPDGRLDRSIYWLRATVDDWLPFAPRRRASPRGRPDNRRPRRPERAE